LQDGFAHGCGVDRLGQDLQRYNIVIAIDDEAGEKVGFAEDESVGVGMGDEVHFIAIGDGGANALGDQNGQISNRTVRDHADCDLR